MSGLVPSDWEGANGTAPWHSLFDNTTQVDISFALTVHSWSRSSSTSSDNSNTLTAFTDVETGAASFHATRPGGWTVLLVAKNGLGSTAVLHNHNFEIFEADTSSLENGPNGVGCGSNGQPADDVLLDGVFSCVCLGTFTGHNCETSLSASSAESRADTSVGEASGIFLGGIAALLLFVLVLFKARRKREVQLLKEIAQGRRSSSPKVVTAAMFRAIDLKQDSLVPALIELGADPAAVHPSTHELPHTMLLRRSDPDQTLLQALFTANCDLDAQSGVLLQQPAKMVALKTTLAALVSWRQPGVGGTVLHRVVDICRRGVLTSEQATTLSAHLLSVDQDLIVAVDARLKTAGDLSMVCDNAVELQRMLTVVVFHRYQLINPSEPLYKSPTALVMEMSDLSRHIDSHQNGNRRLSAYSTLVARDNEVMVVKMMQDKGSWLREIESRSAIGPAAMESIIAIDSAASASDDAPEEVAGVQIHRFNGDSTAHETAIKLMAQYPYAVAMPKADRSLLEIIANERLAAEPLGSVRFTIGKIAKCVEALHKVNVIHGDLKPRNIVRTLGNAYRLIDFDMAFVANSAAASALPLQHADSGKILTTSAYAAPELVVWATATAAGSASALSPLSGTASRSSAGSLQADASVAAMRFDIWSFGVCCYEIVTGTPLVQNSYDCATAGALERLADWNGLHPDEEKYLREFHAGEDASALIDFLRWCLATDRHSRPASMTQLLGHAFLDPDHGAMREHYVTQQIKELLLATGDRPYVKVMISYSWADTGFVLSKLALALAPIVEGIWLDRLGGDQGMGEWTRDSMEKGVEGADVVIAVVSPSFAASANCGFEMQLAERLGKPIIPIKLGVPFGEWPPVKVGDTPMTTQFENTETGDVKLFIDFEDKSQFASRLKQELLPRLARVGGAAGAGSAPGSPKKRGLDSAFAALEAESEPGAVPVFELPRAMSPEGLQALAHASVSEAVEAATEAKPRGPAKLAPIFQLPAARHAAVAAELPAPAPASPDKRPKAHGRGSKVGPLPL